MTTTFETFLAQWRLNIFGVLGFFLLIAVLLLTVGKVPLRYNFRNLVVRWKTSLLTILAFVMVVGLMTVMLAFVMGMYKLTQGSGHPGNVIVLSEGALDELFSNLDYDKTSPLENWPTVERNDNNQPLVSWETYLVVNQPIANAEEGKPNRRFVQLRGLLDPIRSGQVHDIELKPSGQWFSDAGVQPLTGENEGETAIQAVLGEGIASVIGKDRGKSILEIGDVFEVGPKKWIVTGILNSRGSTFDSEIWAKQNQVGPMFGKNRFTTVVIRTKDKATAEATATNLDNDYKETPLNAQSELAYYDKLNSTNQQFLFSIMFVAVFLAIGGVLGVMNTMYAAISQRIKDIGVMRILGFKRFQILASFFLESLMLALIGGAIGCAIGSLADGWTASSIVGRGQGGGKSVVLEMVVDPNILLTGIAFALVMGAIGGLFPSLSAMRLKPLDAVR